jgi:hypothetical protein
MLVLSILLLLILILILRLAYYESFTIGYEPLNIYDKHKKLNNLYSDLIDYYTRTEKPNAIEKLKGVKFKCSSAPKNYVLKYTDTDTKPSAKNTDLSKTILNMIPDIPHK